MAGWHTDAVCALRQRSAGNPFSKGHDPEVRQDLTSKHPTLLIAWTYTPYPNLS